MTIADSDQRHATLQRWPLRLALTGGASSALICRVPPPCAHITPKARDGSPPRSRPSEQHFTMLMSRLWARIRRLPRALAKSTFAPPRSSVPRHPPTDLRGNGERHSVLVLMSGLRLAEQIADQ